jgi:hypothetical protein
MVPRTCCGSTRRSRTAHLSEPRPRSDGASETARRRCISWASSPTAVHCPGPTPVRAAGMARPPSPASSCTSSPMAATPRAPRCVTSRSSRRSSPEPGHDRHGFDAATPWTATAAGTRSPARTPPSSRPRGAGAREAVERVCPGRKRRVHRADCHRGRTARSGDRRRRRRYRLLSGRSRAAADAALTDPEFSNSIAAGRPRSAPASRVTEEFTLPVAFLRWS